MHRADHHDASPSIKLRFGAGAALGLLIAMMLVWLYSLQGPVILLATILGCMFLFGFLAARAPQEIWDSIDSLLS